MINKIISVILTVLFAVDSFFCGFMTCNRIKIEESDETVKKILDAAQYLGLTLSERILSVGEVCRAARESNLPYYNKVSELINKGLLDNFGYHNHDFDDKYFNNMSQMYSLAGEAGIKAGGINSESGIVGADAAFIAEKALYTRSKGADGFVSFSFRKNPEPENDINDFAFLDEYLQPTEAEISYATVIRFLGQATFEKNCRTVKILLSTNIARQEKI